MVAGAETGVVVTPTACPFPLQTMPAAQPPRGGSCSWARRRWRPEQRQGSGRRLPCPASRRSVGMAVTVLLGAALRRCFGVQHQQIAPPRPRRLLGAARATVGPPSLPHPPLRTSTHLQDLTNKRKQEIPEDAYTEGPEGLKCVARVAWRCSGVAWHDAAWRWRGARLPLPSGWLLGCSPLAAHWPSYATSPCFAFLSCRIYDVVVGTGAEAEQGKRVVVHVRPCAAPSCCAVLCSAPGLCRRAAVGGLQTRTGAVCCWDWCCWCCRARALPSLCWPAACCPARTV